MATHTQLCQLADFAPTDECFNGKLLLTYHFYRSIVASLADEASIVSTTTL